MLLIDNMVDDTYSEAFQCRFTRYFSKSSKWGPLTIIRQIKKNYSTLPHSGNEPIVISGSEVSINDDYPWELGIKKLIEKSYQRNIPLMGICHGHQLMAKTLYGKGTINRAPRPEFGWHKLDRADSSEDDVLFKGIEGALYCTNLHFDQVTNLPPEAQVLYRADGTHVQAMRIGNMKMWGLQFHPEVGVSFGEEFIKNSLQNYTKEELNLREFSSVCKNYDIFDTLMDNFMGLEA